MIGIIGFMSYANDSAAENLIDVETTIKETLKKEKGLSVDVNISFLDIFKVKHYIIYIDCEGDGIWDIIYEGNLDEANLDAMIDYLLGSC